MRALRFALAALTAGSAALLASPSPEASRGFDEYCSSIEARLARQHGAAGGFLAVSADGRLERLMPAGAELRGALLHHWRGTAVLPGVHAADFDRLMRDAGSWPRVFAPQIMAAGVRTNGGPDRMLFDLRLRQHHVITVLLDVLCEVTFGRLDEKHRYSLSRSVRVSEADSADDHGYLWRLNTYWSWEEHDSGLLAQVENVSLTRSVPMGLGWAVGPYLESIPRESLEFTLQSVRKALERKSE
jgi:hypothetical protein